MFIDIARGLLGIVSMLAICYIFSKKRSAIDWRLVGIGTLLQFILAFLILKVSFVNKVFDVIAKGFQQVIGYTYDGAEFMFGSLVSNTDSLGYIVAFQILPTIVFFSALSSILYYFGILQKLIYGFAWIMQRTMRLSGRESLAAAANVFIGQTEAPLVVKPYLEKMSRSEMFCLMTGGMATIAGGVFAAYIGFLGGDDPDAQREFAKHLLVASIISAPAAIVAAKMLVPETEQITAKEEANIQVDVGNNLLDAISRGTTDGLKLAVNVGVMLLVFTSLVYMTNDMLMYGPGEWFNLNERVAESTNGRFKGFTFTYLIGLIFAPFAWLLGTPTDDIMILGQLLGKKTVINEFFAYADFLELRKQEISLQPKSIIIATYALCGFANFASIGIQIGGIGVLAPGQRKSLTELGLLAVLGGTIASFLTAAIAGMLVDESSIMGLVQ